MVTFGLYVSTRYPASSAAGYFIEDLVKTKKLLQQMDKKMEIVISKCTTLLNKDEFTITWLIGLLSVNRKYPKNFDKLYEKQLEILQKGRQDNYNESMKELDDIMR